VRGSRDVPPRGSTGPAINSNEIIARPCPAGPSKKRAIAPKPPPTNTRRKLSITALCYTKKEAVLYIKPGEKNCCFFPLYVPSRLNLMTSAIALLEKLLEDDTVSFKEHVIESSSRHVEQERCEQSFNNVVREITAIWNEPEFNSQIRKQSEEKLTASGEYKKVLATVVPPWCQGMPKHGGIPKALRLAHWKRPEGILYVVLRTEIDAEKNRPLYYDLVLGARRRSPDVGRTTVKLRQTKKTWMAHVVEFFHWLFGR
jgi:hypothetical protein